MGYYVEKGGRERRGKKGTLTCHDIPGIIADTFDRKGSGYAIGAHAPIPTFRVFSRRH